MGLALGEVRPYRRLCRVVRDDSGGRLDREAVLGGLVDTVPAQVQPAVVAAEPAMCYELGEGRISRNKRLHQPRSSRRKVTVRSPGIGSSQHGTSRKSRPPGTVPRYRGSMRRKDCRSICDSAKSNTACR